jgi:tetratricopeptide (TPR) repeat protein
MKQLLKKVPGLLSILLLIPLFFISSTAREYSGNEIKITSSSPKATEFFIMGREAFEMGRYDDATQAIQRALSSDPNFASAWLYNYFLNNDEFEKQKSIFNASQLIDDINEGEKLLIKIAWADKNNLPDKRFELTKKLAEIYPESPRVLLMLAGEYQLRGKTNHYRDFAYKAISVDPDSPLGYRALGASYVLHEPIDFTLAIKKFEKFVELRPNEASAYIALGDAHRANLNLEKALANYIIATEIDPEATVSLAKTGYLSVYTGKYDDARTAFQKARMLASTQKHLNYNPHCLAASYLFPLPTMREEANVASKKNMNQQNNKIVPLEGDSENCYFCCTLISMNYGFYVADYKEMSPCQCLNREFIFESKIPERITFEGFITFAESFKAAQNQNYEWAETMARQYAQITNPDIHITKNEAYNFLTGLINLKKGNYTNAISNFKKSDLNNICVKYNLGLVYDKLGNWEEAKKMFSTVASCKFANYSEVKIVKLANDWLDSYAMNQDMIIQ